MLQFSIFNIEIVCYGQEKWFRRTLILTDSFYEEGKTQNVIAKESERWQSAPSKKFKKT